MNTLEQRYLRLLALYPGWHRQRYQAEMLTTLMEGAADKQRAPRLRESLDLLWNAVRMRLVRGATADGNGAQWTVAAAVFGPLAAITLAALILMNWLGQLGWSQRFADQRMWGPFDWLGLALGAGFTVIGVLAIAGWRKAAAALACVAVLAYGGWQLAEHGTNPYVLIERWPLIVFMATVAACLAFSTTTRPRLRNLIGTRLLVLFMAAAASVAVSIWIDAKAAHVIDHGTGMSVTHWGGAYSLIPRMEIVGVVPLVIYLAFLAIDIRVLAKMGAAMRNRALTFAAVPILMHYLTPSLYYGLGFYGFGDSGVTFHRLAPVQLTAAQWLGLLVLPVMIFAICFLWLRRKETRDELIAIGRAHKPTGKMLSGEMPPDAADR